MYLSKHTRTNFIIIINLFAIRNIKRVNTNKGVARLKFKRSQSPLPSFPSPSFLFSPFPSPPLPLLSRPTLPARGSVERCELPSGVWGKPQPLNDLVHIWAKKNDSGDAGNKNVLWKLNKWYLCAVLSVSKQACIAYGVWAMKSATMGSDRDHNPCLLSSLQKNKRKQLPLLASY